MTTLQSASATSSAPTSAFFARWADMSTWPEWNADTEWVRLDGPFIEGATGQLKPKGGPKVRFVVTSLNDREFVDVSHLLGARLTFAHHIEASSEGSKVDVEVTLAGPLAPAWNLILGKGIKTTLQRDLDALVASAEQDWARGPAMSDRLVSEFDAGDSPGLLLWQVTNRWQAAQRAVLKPHGLTHVQFVVLACLTWLAADGPVTQKALADLAALDPMMTSQVLRTLESAGLVVRGDHPTDRRAKALTVTADGRALANRAVVSVESCDRAFFAPLGKPAQLTASLRALMAQG